MSGKRAKPKRRDESDAEARDGATICPHQKDVPRIAPPKMEDGTVGIGLASQKGTGTSNGRSNNKIIPASTGEARSAKQPHMLLRRECADGSLPSETVACVSAISRVLCPCSVRMSQCVVFEPCKRICARILLHHLGIILPSALFIFSGDSMTRFTQTEMCLSISLLCDVLPYNARNFSLFRFSFFQTESQLLYHPYFF